MFKYILNIILVLSADFIFNNTLLFSMGNKEQEKGIINEKILECTKMPAAVQNLIAQFASNGWQIFRTLNVHTNRVSTLSITADGTILLSGSYDGTAKVWNVENAKNTYIYDSLQRAWINTKTKYLETPKAQSETPVMAKISNTGNYQIITLEKCLNLSSEGIIKDDYLSCSHINGIMPARITALQFSSNDKYLAVGSYNNDGNDYSFKVLDINSQSCIYKLMKSRGYVNDIVSFSGSNFIVATDTDIFLLNIHELIPNVIFPDETKIVFDIKTLTEKIAYKLAVTNDGKYLAYSYANEKKQESIDIMDLESKKIIESLEVGCVNCFNFSNGGHYLAIGSSPSILSTFPRSCDSKEHKQRQELLSDAKVNHKTIKIWDLQLREYTQNFVFDDLASCVIFCPKSNDMFVGLNNGKILHLKLINHS